MEIGIGESVKYVSMICKGETITCVLGLALVHGFPNFYPNSEMLVKQTKQ